MSARGLPEPVREGLKQAAFRLGVGPRARAAKRAFEPAYITRDRADNAALRAVLAAVLAPGDNCVDVGAHDGMFLADAVRLAPGGHHLAFEPLPHMCAELARRHPEADVRQVALSDHAGEAEFVHVPTLEGWSGLRELPYPGKHSVQRLTVTVQRLDDALPDDYVPAFIKIDVNGAEREVLAGALDTLTRHKPLVAFEHGFGAADHYSTGPEDIFSIFHEEGGMRIFDFEGNGPYSRGEFVEAFGRPDRVNFLARE